MTKIYHGRMIPLDPSLAPMISREATGALTGTVAHEPVEAQSVPLPEYVAAEPVAAPLPERAPSVLAWKPAARPVNPPAVAVHPPGNSFNDAMRQQAVSGGVVGPAIVPTVRLHRPGPVMAGYRSRADV